jgi:predicted exporter
MDTATSKAGEEAQIRQVMEDWVQALRSKDVNIVGRISLAAEQQHPAELCEYKSLMLDASTKGERE